MLCPAQKLETERIAREKISSPSFFSVSDKNEIKGKSSLLASSFQSDSRSSLPSPYSSSSNLWRLPEEVPCLQEKPWLGEEGWNERGTDLVER